MPGQPPPLRVFVGTGHHPSPSPLASALQSRDDTLQVGQTLVGVARRPLHPLAIRLQVARCAALVLR
jgi:hypothetical protein